MGGDEIIRLRALGRQEDVAGRCTDEKDALVDLEAVSALILDSAASNPARNHACCVQAMGLWHCAMAAYN